MRFQLFGCAAQFQYNSFPGLDYYPALCKNTPEKMRLRKFIPAALALLALPACSRQCDMPPTKRSSTSSVKITHSYAGLLIKEPSGRYSYQDLHIIPMREGQAFGWWMRVESDRVQMRCREELEFPSPPPDSALAPEPAAVKMIAPDGRTIITEKVFYPRNHWLSHIWTMHKNYPRGKYVFRVYLDDIPVGVFPFETE